MKLNVGCGNTKLDGYINIDVDETLTPDLVHNIIEKPLPYEKDSVDQIVFFHTIEHISKRFHISIVREFFRVLKPNGEVWITFPDFEKCVERWKDNYHGQREFYEATIYGRQASLSDYHVCICTVDYVAKLLLQWGFDPYFQGYEPHEPFNGIVKARKTEIYSYEDVMREVVWQQKQKSQET